MNARLHVMQILFINHPGDLCITIFLHEGLFEGRAHSKGGGTCNYMTHVT